MTPTQKWKENDTFSDMEGKWHPLKKGEEMMPSQQACRGHSAPLAHMMS